jgi:thiol-disulfide isomerase/thioredoxin
MVLTSSTMLELGEPLPLAAIQAAQQSGQLEQASGRPLDLQGLAGRPVLVMFLCAHCPFVKHIEPELSRLEHDLASSDLAWLGISSNSTLTHPQDGPEGLRQQAGRCGWDFPYMHDRDQSVAQAFRAACTPDLFLFNPQHQLAYRGQLDASRPGNNRNPDGLDLRHAVAAVLSGLAAPEPQHPSIGCNIKWHPGREPAWAR